MKLMSEVLVIRRSGFDASRKLRKSEARSGTRLHQTGSGKLCFHCSEVGRVGFEPTTGRPRPWALWHDSGPCDTGPMTSREDVPRLLDAVPETRLPALERILRASSDGPFPAAPRRFASAGTLSAEHDLAERSEDILREDTGDDRPA
jgi:hypothetical protein